ncbi:cyanophycinase [Pseudomonas sp. JS3066]|uniref:cyanophycinase n=1 Tax=Pseudomonas sp. JS3066 TaxID=3090665 RepID=UPI002E7C0852|nr:cyanophycinase [Pseudomonas sp. JS3066]WVK95751.1 cyanophycinase [Pseudomonas sp. JS3066]
MRTKPGALIAALLLAGHCASPLAEGHLIAVGGMLRASNVQVYEKFIELAGARDQSRIVIFPTASGSLSSSKRFQSELQALGVPIERISIIGIDKQNYQSTMNDPAVLEPLSKATAVWFVGGDQARIARALYNSDGSESKTLQAVRAVFDRGGVVAGTSAGASVLGETMPTAYGVVMDTLDFGVAEQADQRGTALLKGAGLFKSGIIDQHFDQIEETSSGRAARMASYLIGQKVTRGFGIDTNTAVWVQPGGRLQVIGEGYLTVMDASQARKQFGIYGTRLSGVQLAMLGAGDSYDTRSGKVMPAEGKSEITAGQEYLNGNQLITDLSAVSAISRAVLYGLADNTATHQFGLMTRYNPSGGYHYGYRFKFSEGEGFKAHSRIQDSLTSYTVQNVGLEIEPVDANLRDPAYSSPQDATASRWPNAVRAVNFRGLMVSNSENRFEPKRAMSRFELANALQMTLAAEPALEKLPTFEDVPYGHPLREPIEVAVSNGWMAADKRFDGEREVTRAEWAVACKALVEGFSKSRLQQRADLKDLGGIEPDAAEAASLLVGEGWMTSSNGLLQPQKPVSREEVALTLARLIGLEQVL